MEMNFKHNLRFRLLTIIIVSILISASCVGYFLFRYFDSFLHDRVDANLQKYLGIVEFSFNKEKLLEKDTDYMKHFADNFSRLLDCRITIIDTGGVVVTDSEVPMDQLYKLENHAHRPEIIASARQPFGRNIRRSMTLGQDLLYMAKRLEYKGHPVGYLRLAVHMEMFSEMLSTSRDYFLIAGFLVLLISSILVGIFSKRISSNLFEIISKANTIAKGDLQARIEIESKDELAKLSNNLNNMASKLSDSLTKLQQDKTRLNTVLSSVNDGIIAIDHHMRISFFNQQALDLLNIREKNITGMEINELVRHQHLQLLLNNFQEKPGLVKDDVQMDNRILDTVITTLKIEGKSNGGAVIVLRDISNYKMLEKIRREFVANVSHEFKTPIAAIRGYAETLLDWGLKDKKTRSKYTKNIVKQCIQLENLISDLLQLARIEKMQSLEFRAFDPIPVIDDIIAEISENALAKKIKLQKIFPANDSRIVGDPEMFRSIMINLIDNAIKYTPDEGFIDVMAEVKKRHVLFSVKDSGIGIPADEQNRIFERFYRVDKARSRSVGGTGLGLSIVKHLAELQKADVKLESHEGKGSIFTVWFNKEE